MILRNGFAPQDRAEVARLYWTAFGSKLGRVLGPERKALELIERVLCPAHAICAYGSDGRLLGVVGFQTATGSLAGGGLADFRAVYGRFGAYWRSACIGALVRHETSPAFLLDGLFVRPEARGRGIGTALLEAAAREAFARGFTEIGLDVIDDNPRARALYERRGFQAVGSETTGLLRFLFGFRSSTKMIRRLA